MPAIWSWIDQSFDTQIGSTEGVMTWTNSVLVPAPQSVQRILYQFAGGASQYLFNPPEIHWFPGFTWWATLSTVKGGVFNNVWTRAEYSPPLIDRAQTKQGNLQETVFWQCPEKLLDAEVRLAPVPPPAEDNQVSFSVIAQATSWPWFSDPGQQEPYFWLKANVRVLTSQPS